MSDLLDLTARIGRRIASAPYAMTVDVSDATGTQSASSGVAARPGRRVDVRAFFVALSRLMVTAHKGSVISVTFDDTGDVLTLAAPGGAFDGRRTTPNPATAQGTTSPSPDLRVLTVGEFLPEPTRSIYIMGEGNVSVKTLGTQSEFQPTFRVPGPQAIPVQVVEIGPDTDVPIIGIF